MSMSRVTLMPCAPYDLEGVENWTNAQAKYGWRPRSFLFLLPYLSVLEYSPGHGPYRVTHERPNNSSRYACRMPFVFRYIAEGRPPKSHDSGDIRQMALSTLVGMLALPILFSIRGLSMFGYIPDMLGELSLFAAYPIYTAIVSVCAACILTILVSVLYTAVCALRAHPGAASGGFFIASHIAELIWLLALGAQLILLSSGVSFYPVI